jgi:hypothetical protein
MADPPPVNEADATPSLPDPVPDHPPRSKGTVVGRAAWAIADQTLSSMTNFALAVGVANQVSTADFGAFSIAFAGYLVALTVSRAISSDPLMIRYSARPERDWRGATGRAAASAVMVGVVGGGIAVLAAVVLGGSLGLALFVLGIGLPALLLQDSWRYAFFAIRRGSSAFVNDLVWTVVLAAAYVVLVATGQRSAGAFVLAWVVGALAAALFGMAQARVVPDLRTARSWWSEHRDIAPRMAVEAAVLSGAQPLTLVAMGFVSSLATVGTIRAGQVLMNAVHIATYGIHLFGVPEAVRMLERSTHALMRFCLVLSAGLMGISLAWGMVLLWLPQAVGQALLADSWAPARTVLVPAIVLSVAAGAQGGAVVGLRSLAAASRSLNARIISSLFVSTLAIVGAAIGGAPGGAWGMALGLCVGSAAWWWLLILAIRERNAGALPSDRVGRIRADTQPG